MIDINDIPVLKTYKDWLTKAKYDYNSYIQTYTVYELANCLLTLNAIPEWILKSTSSPQKLKELAESKLIIMKASNGFILEENKVETDLNHQLRFIRLFCNHSKHGDKKDKLPEIMMGAPFPIKLPIKFSHIKIGRKHIEAKKILANVIDFWEKEIN